jgi:hypothetical protein
MHNAGVITGSLSFGQTALNGSTPTQLSPQLAMPLVTGVRVSNTAASTIIYIGGPGVTAGNGYPIKGGNEHNFPTDDISQLYGITATGSVTVAWEAG